MNRVLFCLIVVASLYVSPALADEKWQWIKVTNNAAYGWQSEMGTAAVTIKGQTFEASLFWRDKPDDVLIRLLGTIKKGQIKVTETLLATDLAPAEYTGKYEKMIWSDPFQQAKGTETITLSDGYNMIGLRRNIAK